MPFSPKRTNNATLADVAKAAGVATMTVSRYLNEHPNIYDKTARKVRAAIDALGYKPNHAARMLMGQPSKVIGLILPNLANQFFSSIAHVVQQTAFSHGYLLWIAASNDNPASDMELIERMREYHVDGILIAASPQTTVTADSLGELPVIAVDRPLRGTVVDFVTIDDRTAARDAVTHLIDHGYRRIAAMGLDSQIQSIRERIGGYEEALRSRGLRPLPYARCDDAEAALQVVRKLTSGKQPIDAIFPVNGDATLVVLEAMDNLGLTMPKPVALFSFGDMNAIRLIRPHVSAVLQPVSQMAEQATKMLLRQIKTHSARTGIRISIPASLIIRESCGCKGH